MKIGIIGGVAGGATAAARLRRLDETAEITVFEKGEHVAFANCGLPYHISGVIKKRERLILKTPEDFKLNFNIDVRTRSEVVSIDRDGKKLKIRDLKNSTLYEEAYDKLILAPGGTPILPRIQGMADGDLLTLRDIADMDRILETIRKSKVKSVLIIGGGYIGVELAENLKEAGMEVDVVEMAGQIMATLDAEMANILHARIASEGIHVHLNDTVVEVRGKGPFEAILKSGEKLSAEMIVAAIGVRPDSRLAKEAGLEMGETGGILVDKALRTSDPDIYACGDAIEILHFVGKTKMLIPLAGPANKQARVVADNICGMESSYESGQGTGIVKVFDLTAGMTGLNEKQLKRLKLPYQVIHTHPASHAGYYPGATLIHMKVLFDDEGKILGAQAIGNEGVDKRIDVLSTAIRADLPITRLKELELCYAPPYGAAKDPVNMVGFIGENILKGLVRMVTPLQAEEVKDPFYLDVATPEEFRLGHIEKAVNIPLYELRKRLSEIPVDRNIIINCQSGLRSYNAYRILAQNGFKSLYNLSGGYKTYRHYRDLPENAVRTIKNEQALTGHESDSSSASAKEEVTELDLCGLQCPGPILSIRKKMEEVRPGTRIRLIATDEGFIKDLPAFCTATGIVLGTVEKKGTQFFAEITKPQDLKQGECVMQRGNQKTMVVFSGELDRAMAVFIIANGARAMGSEVTLFFTFWGLNILRKDEPSRFEKGFLEKAFGFMMPRGANRLGLSKFNFWGLGSKLMKWMMKNKNVNSLPSLIQTAKESGIKLIACSMSMDVMGIRKEELIDGVEVGGVAHFLGEADKSNMTMFI